jgi:hypothetical protein
MKEHRVPARHRLCAESFVAIDRLPYETHRLDDGTVRLELPSLNFEAPFLNTKLKLKLKKNPNRTLQRNRLIYRD